MNTIIDVMLAIDPSFQPGKARRDASKARVAIIDVEADEDISRAVDGGHGRAGVATRKVRT